LASPHRLAGPTSNLAEHHTRPIVSSAPDPNAETLREFFQLLGERKRSIRAVRPLSHRSHRLH